MIFFLCKTSYRRRGAGRRGAVDRNAPFTRKRGMGVPAPLRVHSHLCAQTEAGALPSPAPPFGCCPCTQTGGTCLGLCMHPGSCAPNEGEQGRGGTKTGGAPPSPVHHPIQPVCKPGVGLRAASH